MSDPNDEKKPAQAAAGATEPKDTDSGDATRPMPADSPASGNPPARQAGSGAGRRL